MSDEKAEEGKKNAIAGPKPSIRFEDVLAAAASLPGVRIDRDSYLRSELKARYPEYAEASIETTPLSAGLALGQIRAIADRAIKWETAKATGLSVAAGIPGGFAMAGTIPADMAQFFAHVIRVAQKLAYLYGWDNLLDENGEMDDDTKGILTLFIGVMMGVQGAGAAIAKIAEQAQVQAAKRIASKALTKGVVYPVVKSVAKYLGINMTKEVFGKGVSKVVPVVGGVVSGGITFVTFLPMANKLRSHLARIAR